MPPAHTQSLLHSPVPHRLANEPTGWRGPPRTGRARVPAASRLGGAAPAGNTAVRIQSRLHAPPLSWPQQDDPSTPQNQLLGLGDATECPGAPRKQRPARRMLPLSPGAPVRKLSFDDGDAPPLLPRPRSAPAAVAFGASSGRLSKLQKLR